MSRPAVDVVVPFAGSDDALGDLLERMGALERRDGDTLTIVDNRAAAAAAAAVDADAAADARRADPPDADVPHVIAASGQQSSYYARNRGAELGRAPWILFLDADVDPPP